MLKAISLALGKTNSKKLAKISLSNSTIKTRIDKNSNDIECQVLHHLFFAMQCDETTDVAQMSHFLVYLHFLRSTTVEEELLFCRPLKTTPKAEDVLKFVDVYFHEKDMKWKKLVGVCTDDAPVMLGCRSEFIARIKQKNPDVIVTHYAIHREALASKTTCCNEKQACRNCTNCKLIKAVNSRLFAKLCKDMGSNHINLLFHTNVR